MPTRKSFFLENGLCPSSFYENNKDLFDSHAGKNIETRKI
jgi:hypothetical protein